ncbi:hypothetical protein JW911_03540 [Candidatus Peregrinibacteria bacterium]|nr:hypothetical protein [Candidatus Peregrinibacteria bacterium]
MQKTTVFFIGAVVTIVAVVGVLLGYKYLLRHSSDLPDAQIQQTQSSGNIVESSKPDTITQPEPLTTGDTDTPKIIDTPSYSPLASINIEKVSQAGFLDADLRISSFAGIVFETVNIEEYNDDGNIQYKILENSINSGIISELIFPEEKIAENVYRNVQNKFEEMPVFTINETNQYGELSFFANNAEEKNSVFLVVKKGTRLYTFHYPARNHNKIKNLIGLL